MSTPPAPYSEDDLALTFAFRHAEFRSVLIGGSRRWFVHCEGEGWRPDLTLLHLDAIRDICREAAGTCDDPQLARELCSAATVYAVERLARTDRRLAAERAELGLPPKKKAASRRTVRAAASTTADDPAEADSSAVARATAAAEEIIARGRRA
jgi:hypothetical protein